MIDHREYLISILHRINRTEHMTDKIKLCTIFFTHLVTIKCDYVYDDKGDSIWDNAHFRAVARNKLMELAGEWSHASEFYSQLFN